MMHSETILKNFNQTPLFDVIINIVFFFDMGNKILEFIWIAFIYFIAANTLNQFIGILNGFCRSCAI